MYDKFLSPDVMPLMCIQNFPLTIVKLYVYVFLSIDNFSDYKKKKKSSLFVTTKFKLKGKTEF